MREDDGSVAYIDDIGKDDLKVERIHSQLILRVDAMRDEMREELKGLRTLIERLIRVEERQTNHTEVLARFGRRLDAIDVEVIHIKQHIASSSITIKWLERFIWAALASVPWIPSIISKI